jgi:activator of 2-hydroxyglutaryl-CoA dehydratase
LEKKKKRQEEELNKRKKKLEEEFKSQKKREINNNKYSKKINNTVVGIDFGSSKSGFAFIIVEKNNIVFIDEITKEIEFKDYIEKSCIIIKDNKLYKYHKIIRKKNNNKYIMNYSKQ